MRSSAIRIAKTQLLLESRLERSLRRRERVDENFRSSLSLVETVALKNLQVKNMKPIAWIELIFVLIGSRPASSFLEFERFNIAQPASRGIEPVIYRVSDPIWIIYTEHTDWMRKPTIRLQPNFEYNVTRQQYKD
jgi:hypothetical protein